MDERLELHETLCEFINITEPDGDRHVYFQPPENLKMKYPAIRYKLKNIDGTHADNKAYALYDGFEVILIDRNPNSPYVKKIVKLPRCKFDRHYVADNLNHWVFTLYKIMKED